MLTINSQHACHGGMQFFYQHDSTEIGLPMRFSVFVPPDPVPGMPAVLYLAGLTCNEETFPAKGGAQQFAAREGLVLIAPDTSPRGAGVPGEVEHWDLGVGAGFYVDAVISPWKQRYRMFSYLTVELLPCLIAQLQLDPARIGVMGHSMGGHGALVMALRCPQLFRSVSALAPIASPSSCPWGEKALSAYLGGQREFWNDYDATALMLRQTAIPYPKGILIDQGMSDKFLDEQLKPELFEQACLAVGQPLTLRRHAGYDHGYYFVSSFIEAHLMHHARQLAL